MHAARRLPTPPKFLKMDLNKPNLPDIQSTPDLRNIPINRVGVRGITLPVAIHCQNGIEHTIANITMTVSLPANQKGTHMSRFITVMEELEDPLSPEVMKVLMKQMLELLDARDGTIEVRFPFFIRKQAPVSKLESIMNYEGAWIANCTNGEIVVTQETLTPVTSLCPCSKEISSHGAHNQRSHVTTSIIADSMPSLQEQVQISERAASCPLWSRLKRADEKYVTEFAYENPKFVEDLVRDIATAMNQDERIRYYRITAENFESIHNHSAYAVIEHRKTTNI